MLTSVPERIVSWRKRVMYAITYRRATRAPNVAKSKVGMGRSTAKTEDERIIQGE